MCSVRESAGRRVGGFSSVSLKLETGSCLRPALPGPGRCALYGTAPSEVKPSPASACTWPTVTRHRFAQNFAAREDLAKSPRALLRADSTTPFKLPRGGLSGRSPRICRLLRRAHALTCMHLRAPRAVLQTLFRSTIATQRRGQQAPAAPPRSTEIPQASRRTNITANTKGISARVARARSPAASRSPVLEDRSSQRSCPRRPRPRRGPRPASVATTDVMTPLSSLTRAAGAAVHVISPLALRH